jgi:hypothetical protein
MDPWIQEPKKELAKYWVKVTLGHLTGGYSFIHSFIHLLVHHKSFKNYIPVDVVTVSVYNQLCNTALVQHQIHDIS